MLERVRTGRGRRLRARNPVLGALSRADQTVLRVLRTRGHASVVEGAMKAVGTAGEYAAVWSVIGASAALADEPRRRRWLVATATGPLAVGVNYAVKVAVGRERPLLADHPPLARAPSKLSFPSAHATSSLAAATALGRIEPRARPALLGLAAAICASRPYLGMHYPSDVLAGAALGLVIGAAVPVGRPPAEERLIDLAIDANQRAQRNGEPTVARSPAGPAA